MLNKLLLNFILAFAWSFLTGELQFTNLVEGFIIGYFILWFIEFGEKKSTYFSSIPRLIAFLFYFIYELILANLKVAFDIITPRHRMSPGIIAVPLDIESELGITILSNVITLTPGTLSLDVSNDKKTLYVHALYVDDPNKFRKSIKEGFEKKLMEIFS